MNDPRNSKCPRTSTSATTAAIPSSYDSNAPRVERHQAQPSLSTLILNLSETKPHNDILQPLLRLFGRAAALTSLHVKAHLTNEETMDTIFLHCPLLENLFMASLQVDSMDSFVRGHERGVPLRSLGLPGVRNDSSAFTAFLELLARPSRVQETLQRLSFGRYWPRLHVSETLDVLHRVLETNRTLCYLHVPLMFGRGAPVADFNRDHQGVDIVRPLEIRTQCAFLSVLQQQKQKMHVDRYLAAVILAFAAHRIPRIVDVYVDEHQRVYD